MHAFLGPNVCSATRLTSSCVEQDERLFHSFALCFFFCIFHAEKKTPQAAADVYLSSDVSTNAELSSSANLAAGKLFHRCVTMAEMFFSEFGRPDVTPGP